MIGGVKVLDPKKVPGIVYLMPCGKSPHGVDVSPDGKCDHRLRQAAGRDHRLQLREDPDRDPQQGLHRRRGRDPGPEVRVDQGRGGAGRPRPAAHAVRDRRLGLHVAVRRQRDREVEARHLGGRGQGRRCPTRSATWPRPRATPSAPDGNYLVGLNKLSHGRHLIGRPVAARVVAARRHHRGEDEAPLRRVHRARAALRADHQGRQDQADRGLPEGREQAPAGDLGRQGRRRHAQGQQGAGRRWSRCARPSRPPSSR